MCFKPKTPKAPEVIPDYELTRATKEAREAAQTERSEQKRRRTEEALAKASGKFGRSGVLTGGRGGQGFAAPQARSLFEVM